MKSIYQFAIAVLFVLMVNQTNGNILTESDSVLMGGGYANDIYYSMANGEIHSVERTNWDIAFFTNPFSAGIITNDGNGVELYTYPLDDTSGWSTLDTTGLSTWTVLYNSTEQWEEGAFNRNELGHPDYGWCKYNSITHDLIGDSLYIIKFSDGSAKKMWMERKHSIAGTFYFKYADLDGSNEVSEVVDCSAQADKNFLYYSIQNQEILDREPASDSWDILFTKYMGILDGGVPYPVTGVINNVNVPANRFDQVDPNFDEWFTTPFDSSKVSIGHDWKEFNMNTFSYDIHDSVAFFVSDRETNVYKLVFNKFDYTIGNVVFEKSVVSPSNVNSIAKDSQYLAYPNPATDYLVIEAVGSETADEITILDITGKTVFRTENVIQNNRINLDDLNPGLYILSIRSGQSSYTKKVVLQNK